MERRNFLGWLAGSLAVYTAGGQHVDLIAEADKRKDSGRELPEPSENQILGAQRYVIKNHGDVAMSIHYALESVIDTNGRRVSQMRHHRISTIILPGEELTISAAPIRD